MNFKTAFTREIRASLANDYDDNYDYYRFGKQQGEDKSRLKTFVSSLRKKYIYHTGLGPISARLLGYKKHITSFETLYNMLFDQPSKELLIKLLTYRILGHRHVKLPTNNDHFWNQLAYLDTLGDINDTISIPSVGWRLLRYNLHKIGVPIELYYAPLGIYVEFILKQYEYRTQDVVITAQRGDVVIDAGGCWGDTALYFADVTGESGKVYTFEFIPSNLEVMKRNLSLNPLLAPIVTIVKRPVWSESGKNLFYIDNGPGSKVSFDQTDDSADQIATVAIDDWVEANAINKVDFIKMDIEGAELNALIGAEKTIRRHRPKLAIALYHRLEDFKEIPAYLKSLGLGYNYFLGHYTIHAEETVLFATI
jgi:FkbM family methyltransferase